MNSKIEIPDQFVHSNPMPIIKVKGTHLAIGRQIGEAFRNQIQDHINNTQELIRLTYKTLELDWAGARMQDGNIYRLPGTLPEVCRRNGGYIGGQMSSWMIWGGQCA
jgi:hypothetical protein